MPALDLSDGAQEQLGELLGHLGLALRALGRVPVRQVVHVAEEVRDEDRARHVRTEDALRLALLEEGSERVVILAATPRDLLAPRLGQHVHAAKEDRALGQEVDRRLYDVDTHVSDDVLDRSAARDDAVQVRLLEREHAVVDREQQVVLGLEVVVHGALGDARGLDDLLHARGGVALGGEQVEGGGRDPVGDVRALHDSILHPTGLMLAPPSIRSVWPVTHAASSDSRKATGPATSSGTPRRWSGYRAATCDSPLS